jgi:CRISPR/Cas system Type II protein with McrA/HNH and RuvC-like nuclease domain
MTNKVPEKKLKVSEVDSEMKDASEADNLPALRKLKSKISVTLRREPVNETVQDVDNLLREKKLAVRLSKIAAVAIPKAVRSKKSEVELYPEKRAGHISNVPAVPVNKAHEIHKVLGFDHAADADEAEAAKDSMLATKKHELLMHKANHKEGKAKQSAASRLSEKDETWGGEGGLAFASAPLRGASRMRYYTEEDIVGSSI